MDGIICSNTTIDHNDPNGHGGVSGRPLREKATKSLRRVKELVGDEVPIMASGGVMTVEDYMEKIDAGANLVQLYTGLIYRGPGLVQSCIQAIGGYYDAIYDTSDNTTKE